MKRKHKDWVFAVVVCGIIVVAMSGGISRTPFEVDKSFTRSCTSFWLGQKYLRDIREIHGKFSITDTCTCITDKMKAYGATKDEFAALIQWLTTTRNYDYKKYYELVEYDGVVHFDNALHICTNSPIDAPVPPQEKDA